MMLRIVVAAAAVALGTSAVLAQSEPITARKAMMKGVSDQYRAVRDMSDGKRPFDLAAAKKAFATFAEAGAKLPALFPDSSKSGDTAALPAIWENKSDFDAKFTRLETAAKTDGAKITDASSLKDALGDVGKSCGGCHQTYRKKT